MLLRSEFVPAEPRIDSRGLLLLVYCEIRGRRRSVLLRASREEQENRLSYPRSEYNHGVIGNVGLYKEGASTLGKHGFVDRRTTSR